MEFLPHLAEPLALLLITVFQMISAQDSTTMIFTIQGASAASIPTATIQSDLIFPLQTMYSSGMRGDATTTVTNIQTQGGNTVIDILVSFSHLQKVQVSELGLLSLEYMTSNSWSLTIGGNSQTFLSPVQQRHTDDTGTTQTVDISEPCSLYVSFGWCGTHGTCVPVVSRPYCNCDVGYCGQFCGGDGNTMACIGEFMASGDSVNTNKVGTCPATTTTCNNNVLGASSCTNDFDCDGFDFCCPTTSFSLCCMPGVEVPEGDFAFVTANVPLFFYGSTYNYGMPALTFNGNDGTLCNTGWTATDTSVACQELGFQYGGELNQHFIDVSAPLSPFIKNVDCFGAESKISQCNHDGWLNVDGCSSSTNVGLLCYDMKDSITMTMAFQTSNIVARSGLSDMDVVDGVDAIFSAASMFDVVSQVTSTTQSGLDTLITLKLSFDLPADSHAQTKYVYTLVDAIESNSRVLSTATQNAPVGEIHLVVDYADKSRSTNNVLLSPTTSFTNRRCTINNAKNSCTFGSCAVAESGDTYCNCDPGYNGQYCQKSVSYPTTALQLSIGSDCYWYTGIYEVYYDGMLNAYYWHRSGQAFFRQNDPTKWEVVQINNDGSQVVLLTGTLDSGDPYGSPLAVTGWTNTFGSSVAVTVLQITPTSSLLAYGIDAGDTVVPRADSTGTDKLRLHTALSLPSGGLYFEREMVNRIYINDFGSVSFGALYDFSVIPSTVQDVNMIFPFLAQQSFTCPGQTIFYHVYKSSVQGDSTMISDINTRVRTHYSSSRELNTFSASYVVLVTWYQGRKGLCDYALTCLADQSNTYQLALAVSGTYTIAIFLYEPTQMSDAADVLRGYINSRSTDSVDALSPLDLTQSSIRNGILDPSAGPLFFRVGTNIVETPECVTWYKGTVDLTSLSTSQLDTVQACPYTARQAQLDFLWASVSSSIYKSSIPERFATDPANAINCYSPYSLRTVALDSLSYSVVQTCCYDTNSGARVTTSDGKSGFLTLLDSSTISGTISDQAAYSRCCVDPEIATYSTGDLCPLFYSRRPKNNSQSYAAPFPFISFGDPHFITSDGAIYTFNPSGEFVLLKTNDYEIQARLTNNIGADHRASAYTAVAARDAWGSNAYVGLNKDKDGFIIYTGLAYIDKCANDRSNFMFTSDMTVYVDNIVLYKTGPGSNKITLVFPRSEWVLIVAHEHGIMSISVQAPSSLPSGTSRGLLGILDGNKENDLTSSTGVVVNPDTATNQEIHDNFGMTWRVTLATNSLLCYKEGMTFSQYYDPTWVPQFDLIFNSVAERQSAEKICENNKFCMFDLSALGDEVIALSTLEKIRDYVKNKNILGNKPPQIATIADVDITVGQQMTITVVATDPEGSPVTIGITTGSPGTLANNVFTWQPSSCSPVQIGFTATDTQGAVSSVSVPVLRCCESCSNGGTCDFSAAVVSTVSTFLVAACDCPPGWEGSTCATDRDGCADDPCAEFGTACTDLSPAQTYNNGGIGFRCVCPTGYLLVGGLCLDVDECTSTASTLACDANADCMNTEGSYQCACRSGWTLDTDGVTCLNINECLKGSSGCEQLCTDRPGSFICSCYNGYTLNSDGKTCAENTRCTIKTNCGQLCSITGTGLSRAEECQCMFGYNLQADGATCSDINECQLSPNPCDTNVGSCTNTVPGYTCECQAGYKLSTDQTSCEACPPNYWGNKCQNYCSCSENVDSCDPVTGCTNCISGWEGYNCLTDINECLSALCPEKSQCENTEGGYRCECNSGYTLNAAGDTCNDEDECADPIKNTCSQVCVNTAGSFECQCKSGYTLQTDQVTCSDNDECSDSPSPCSKANDCFNLPGSYECSCNSGYQLSSTRECNDINECSNPILSNCSGSCANSPGSYVCECGSGYTLTFDRKTCIDIDECQTTITNQMHDCKAFTSTCVNVMGTYNCQCNTGYAEQSGSCQDVNECTLMLHNCDQICVNSEGNYSCECETAFDLQPDGRSCVPAAAATCAVGCDYECVDLQDGQGPQCRCMSGYTLNADGHSCNDVDECADGSQQCEYQASCTNVPGTYNCACESGYELSPEGRICIDVNECETNTNSCPFMDLCVNTPGDFYCACPTGFSNTSKTSCTDIDECSPNSSQGPCSNSCVNTKGSYYCECPTTAELQPDGVSCFDINECAAVLHDCSEFAVCANTDPGYSCTCMPGYNSTDQGRTCTPTFTTIQPTAPVVTVLTTARTLPSSPTRAVIQLVSPTNLGNVFWGSPFYQNRFKLQAEDALENLYVTSYMPTLKEVTLTGLSREASGGTVIEFAVITSSAMTPAEQVTVANIIAELNALTINSTVLSIDKVSTMIEDENGVTLLLSATDPCALYAAMAACKNFGTCRQIGTAAECRCSSDYSGDYCETLATDQNVRDLVVALATVGTVLVIFAIMVVGFVIYSRRHRGRRRPTLDDSSSSTSSTNRASIGSRIHFAHGSAMGYGGMWRNPWRRNQFMGMPAHNPAMAGTSGMAAHFQEPIEEEPYPWGKPNQLPRFGMIDGGISGRRNFRNAPYYYADQIE